jgi:hypothetical protein
MLLRTSINKDSVLGLLVGALLMSPALFLSPIRSFLLIEKGEFRIQPFATFLLFIVLILLPFYLGQLGRTTKETRFSLYSFAVVGIISCFNLIVTANNLSTLGYLISCLAPFVAAVLITQLINREVFEASLKMFALAFVVYLLVNFFVWLIILNTRLPNSPGLSYARMGGTFSEPVTLGYLIATLCPIILFYISTIKNTAVRAIGIPITILVLFSSTIATGTRGGIFILVPYVIGWIFSKKRYGLLITTGILIVLFNPIQRYGITVDRFLDLQDEGRTTTRAAGLEYWAGSELTKKVFGYGFGNVYPYNHWLQQNELSNNVFFLGSDYSIIQPHNTFIWLLIEGGLLCLMASLALFIVDLNLTIRNIVSKNQSINSEKATAIFFFLLFTILVNNLDSILVIYPNLSFITWYILVGMLQFRHKFFNIARRKRPVEGAISQGTG